MEHVGQALSAISAPNASPEQVAVANAFLQTCETNPAFPAALLSLYSSSPHPQLQLATILLLTNVLKRNWSSRTRGRNPIVILPENDKKDLRTDILAAYTLHDMQHSKHLNELLKYLTRVDFPNNYPQLAESTLSWINQVSQLLNDNPAAISTPKPLLVLATVKTVTKEYALKKVSHN